MPVPPAATSLLAALAYNHCSHTTSGDAHVKHPSGGLPRFHLRYRNLFLGTHTWTHGSRTLWPHRLLKAWTDPRLIGPHNIVSKQLGSITPLELSGGVKTLLLVRNLPNMVFNASTCGDNCARWLLKIGKSRM